MTAEPSWHRYRESVTAFLPKAAGRELQYRCQIMQIRDNATQSLKRACPEVAPLLEHVMQLGLYTAHTPDIERLPHVHAAMKDSYMVAKRLQMGLEPSRPHPSSAIPLDPLRQAQT